MSEAGFSAIEEIVNLIRDTKLEQAETLIAANRERHPEQDFSYVEMILWAHQGKYHLAYQLGHQLLQKNSEDAQLRFYLARIAIALGYWQEGLALFDSIRGVGPFGGPFLTSKKPLWSREPLIGKTVFLACEGGLGDAVCFARFAEQFSALGANVILGGYEPMFPLLRTVPGVSAVVDVSAIEKTDFDYWIPALSCPRMLAIELKQISGAPYITSSTSSVSKWQQLTASNKPKVALIWQGSESFAEDYLRSIPADKFSKILAHEEFQFFSIRRMDESNSFQHPNMRNIGEHISDPQDLAGFLMNMDLVISVDSGPMHLAGALGVPTLLLNREMGWFTFGANPDKDYLQKSPWYDSLVILHQKRWGHWDETIERAEQILASRAWPKSFKRDNSDELYHPENPAPAKNPVQLTETAFGPMLTMTNDFFVGKALDFYGEYSAHEVDIYRRVLKSGDHVVEVGAHLGALTLAFARLVGPQGHVLAFEPQEFLRGLNRANIALNNIQNVEVREEGLAQKAATIPAMTPDYKRVGNFGALTLKNIVPSDSDRAMIQLIALDSLNLSRVDFIKMDIEGMELEALLGAEKTIQRHRPKLFIENDRPEQSQELLALLSKWNYEVETYSTPLFNPGNFKKQSVNIFGQAGSTNILALPK